MKYDVAIIGAGIVGLATAVHLLQKNHALKIAIIEKESQVARHQTGNNSGVIHSGIYYKPHSLKAKNCLQGYQMLIDFCEQHGVPYDLCGKIIVATHADQLPALHAIYQRGMQNNLAGIRYLNLTQMQEIEPHVGGIQGICVPQTGIINYTTVTQKYAEVFQNKGGTIFFDKKVHNIIENNDGVEVITQNQTLLAAKLINCAGLHSDRIAQMTNKNIDVKIIPFRGEYYTLKPEKQHLVRHLIYPVPDANFPFLGVHFTRMIGGGVEAGPNAVLAYAREGYKKTDINLKDLAETIAWRGFRKVAAKYWRTGIGEFYRSYSKSAFAHALQTLVPEITKNDLLPGGAGVRAQACERNGGLLDDFKIIQTQHQIHVLNAPSPAATSSLSIGKTIADMMA
jgi:L-2-hydroxyglutarate oxidase